MMPGSWMFTLGGGGRWGACRCVWQSTLQ